MLNDLLAYVRANSGAAAQTVDIARFSTTSPGAPEAYTRAAYAFGEFSISRDKRDADYAARELMLALTLNPQFNDARVLLARLRFEQLDGSPERDHLLGEIVSLTNQVLRSEPNRADAMALLGEAYWERNEQAQGMALALHALELAPLNPTTRSAIGRLYVSSGFFESAIVENERAFALDANNVRALGFNILCSYWTNRPADARSLLNRFREWHPGAQAELFAVDEQLRAGNFPEAARLISVGREVANADDRVDFDIADALRLALTGKSPEAQRVWELYKDRPPTFWDDLILLAAQLGQSESAVHLLRQNHIYASYRYLATEHRLSPIYKDASFQALARERYSRWLADLKRYGSSLPAAPAAVPLPDDFLNKH